MSVTKGSSLNEKMDEEAIQAVEEIVPEREPGTQGDDSINEIVNEVDAKLNLDDDAPPTTDMDDFSTDTTSEASVLTIETKEPEPIDNEEIEKLEMAKRRVSLSLPIDENDKFIVTLSSPGVNSETETGVGASERTKKFLESDDAIISQIFSQTITSAGVTPTEDFDFSTGPLPDLITNEVLYATSSSEDVDANEQDDLNDVDDEALMQSEMHAKQRPSIVIDCYDESSQRPFPYYEEPVTPDEKDLGKSFDDQFGEEAGNVIKTEVTEETIVVTITDNVDATGGFYFDQTIDCDDEDVDEIVAGDEGGTQPEAESKSSSESMDITKSGSINEESNDDDEDDGSQAESVVEHFENNETSSAMTTEKVKTKKVVRKTTKTSTTTAASTAYQTTSTSETTAAIVSDSTSQIVEKKVKTNGVATTTEMEVTSTQTNGSVETSTNGDIMADDSGDSPKKSPTKLTKKKSDAGSKKKVKKSKKSDEKENISVQFTEGSITKLLTEKFENITKNAENGKNYNNSRFKVIDFLSLQPSPFAPQPMASPTTVMMMMVSPETGQSQMTNYSNGTTNGMLSPDLRNGRNSPYQDPDEMFDLDIVDHGSDNESEAEDDDETMVKINGDDSYSESASTDSLASSGKMWRHHNGYHDKLSPPVIIGKNFSKNLANSNNKFSTSTNDNFINYSNTSFNKNGGQSDVKKSMKQFSKFSDVEKHDAKGNDLANGLKPPTPPQPQWVKNNTVKYLRHSFGDLTALEDANIDGSLIIYRATSYGDLRIIKQLPIHTGVSVKALRESYCNLVGLNETTATPFFKLQKPGPSDSQFRTLPLPVKQQNQNVRHSFADTSHSDEATNPVLATMTLARKTKGFCGAVADEKKYKNGICVKQFDMKSSFSKFDALQKKNSVLLHQGGNQSSPEGAEKKCRSCDKVVFQMEQIKAERNIWHRNCFRCQECNKQLNVDTYQSHGSVVYCKPHFKALFAPKVVADSEEPVPRRKPELIIRENQPDELPADVVRSSAKQDLGLEELQSLNVKSRFQHFENYQEEHEQNTTLDRSPSGVQRSASIMSKLARFHAKGMDVGISDDLLNGVTLEEDSAGSGTDEGDDEGDEDIELIRARRAARKERPISLNNMNDIKSRFEGNSEIGREERREERKQEIQSIRSRLFMGKQAKIKEMYQQAVADSEQGIVAAGKKPDIDIGDKAKSLKEKFERGEIFNTEDGVQNGQTNGVRSKHSHQQEDSAVFEEGYSKKSRSIFLELDAAAAAQPTTLQRSSSTTPRTPEIRKLNPALTQPENYIKAEDKIEDVVIETAAVSSKFKFFETYKPNEKEKRQFRITPPRDGVVKLPSPDKEIYRDPDVVRSDSKANDLDDSSVAEKTHTASKVLSLFRQMEQQQHQPAANDGLKPLKRFTPPPDADRRRVYDDSEEEKNVTDSEEEEDESEEEEEETDEEDRPKAAYDDEFIKAAKSAARAKQLRDKFEKWEKTEIEREQNNSSINLCEPADQEYASQVESAKSLRAKFESLRDSGSQIQRDSSRIKVNRFV